MDLLLDNLEKAYDRVIAKMDEPAVFQEKTKHTMPYFENIPQQKKSRVFGTPFLVPFSFYEIDRYLSEQQHHPKGMIELSIPNGNSSVVLSNIQNLRGRRNKIDSDQNHEFSQLGIVAFRNVQNLKEFVISRCVCIRTHISLYESTQKSLKQLRKRMRTKTAASINGWQMVANDAVFDQLPRYIACVYINLPWTEAAVINMSDGMVFIPFENLLLNNERDFKLQIYLDKIFDINSFYEKAFNSVDVAISELGLSETIREIDDPGNRHQPVTPVAGEGESGFSEKQENAADQIKYRIFRKIEGEDENKTAVDFPGNLKPSGFANKIYSYPVLTVNSLANVI